MCCFSCCPTVGFQIFWQRESRIIRIFRLSQVRGLGCGVGGSACWDEISMSFAIQCFFRSSVLVMSWATLTCLAFDSLSSSAYVCLCGGETVFDRLHDWNSSKSTALPNRHTTWFSIGCEHFYGKNKNEKRKYDYLACSKNQSSTYILTANEGLNPPLKTQSEEKRFSRQLADPGRTVLKFLNVSGDNYIQEYLKFTIPIIK